MNPNLRSIRWRMAGRLCFYLAVPLVCLLVIVFRVMPLWQEGRVLKGRTAALRQRQQQLRLFARRFDVQAAEERRQLREKLRRQLPDTVSVGSWLTKLDALADRAGVRITALNPLPPLQKQGCRYLPLTLSLEGDYTRLLLFFQLLEQEEQLWYLQGTSLEAKGLQGHLLLQTKLYAGCLKQIHYE